MITLGIDLDLLSAAIESTADELTIWVATLALMLAFGLFMAVRDRLVEPVISALKVIAPYLLAFTAICLVFVAVRIGRRLETRPADPFSQPFGEMPGFTAEQLARLAPNYSDSAGVTALRSADTGSVRLTPTRHDAARLDPRDVFAECWRRPRDGR